MARGILKLQVDKRVLNPKSNARKDKIKHIDKLIVTNFIDHMGRRRFNIQSTKLGRPSVNITRDEIAFVKLLLYYYSPGDYCVLVWAKGKERGYRRFWDGVISNDGQKFIRRKEMSMVKEEKSYYDRISYAVNVNSLIGKYMKTKRSGIWYNL